MSEFRTRSDGPRARPPRGISRGLDRQVGWKDWELKRFLLEEDWVLVTRNSEDFRGPRETRGSEGQYSNVSIHAGLICLNASVGMDLALQRELFSEVLDELGTDADLTNQILEVTLEHDEAGIQIERYKYPAD
jgi:hypothetical protein